ncbi:MAG: YheU family protein [Desulfobacteraceae bacterium]|nr:YheU family protein [Desulfobacteraceae bacterium]
MTIPFKNLSPEALRGVIEEFVTREGTDYGEAEIPLDTKAQQVMNQLQSGKAVIVFDQKTETCNIIPAGDITSTS